MPVWYDESHVAHRLRHPFVYPGGPSVVAEPAAARRHSVQQFQDQATAAWTELLHNIQEGLQIQDQHIDEAPYQQDADQMTLQLQQQQQQHQQHQPSQAPLLPPSHQQQQQQGTGLDLSGLAAPLLPRRRLTGPVQLVPVPEFQPPGPIPQQAAAAAVAAALAAQPPNQGPKEALAVPAGCLELHSWNESANAEDPPGMVATVHDVMPPPPAAAAAAGGGVRGGDDERDDEDDVMEPGSEVVVTLTVMDTSRLQQRQQEIQVLGSNTLAELRDAICCPTDKLAEGLGASNAAAYFYIDQGFYDDTRAAAAAECSEKVEQWAQRLGLSGPRYLLKHFELPEDTQHRVQPQQQELPAPDGGEGLQQEEEQQQQQQQQQQPRQRRQMQHVRVSELVLQASNQPMVLYSHQGLCEHAVVVSDVRLLHAADPSRRSAYPRTVFKAVLGKRLSCGLCRRFGATALMLDHPETPEAVTVLCQLCCGLFSVERHPGARLIMLEPF